MATPSKNTRNLESLEKEILVLRRKAKLLEGKIDDNFTYFQHHSGSLFVRSLLPRRVEGRDRSAGTPILDSFLQNERLQKILIRLADRAAQRLGDSLNWLVDRVFRK